MYKYNSIKKLQLEGLNISEISRELDLDWKTVQKYFMLTSPPIFEERVHRTRKDPLLNFKSSIIELSKIPKINTWDIFNELKNREYLGSYSTVNRYIKTNLDKKTKERYFEQTYSPGDEVQVDFKEDILVKINTKEVLVNLFFASLPYSEKVFVKCYPGLNFECFADGLVSTFEYFEGIPKRVRQDNLKPCVASILKGRCRKYTEKYAKFVEYYGFEISACNPARGNEKGHVERDIQTFSRRIKSRLQIEKVEFNSYSDLNSWILNSIEIMQTGITAKFLEEKQALQPLRKHYKEVITQVHFLSASKFGTVRFGKSVYSVPDGYIDLNLKLEASAYEIKIFDLDNGKIIATHDRLKEESASILLEHVIGSLLRKPQAMLSWKHKDLLFSDEIMNLFYKTIKKQDSYNAERKFLQVLNLIQHRTLLDIKAAIILWIESKEDQPFEYIKNLLIIERRPELFFQEKLEPNLEAYNQFLQNGAEHVYTH
jgi:transposase